MSYAVSPGEYLLEWLEEEGVEQSVAALRLGINRELLNGILCGRKSVTGEIAVRLGETTGIPADSWLRFERQYRRDHVAHRRLHRWLRHRWMRQNRE